jgi:hypothetical protein
MSCLDGNDLFDDSQKADALRAVARSKEAHQEPTSRLLTSDFVKLVQSLNSSGTIQTGLSTESRSYP